MSSSEPARQDEAIRLARRPIRCESQPPTWMKVTCPECGKLLCEVSPGSVVKIRCKQCRVYVEKVA